MRSILAAFFVTPALLSHQVAVADTSLSVPAFTLGISSYESDNEYINLLNQPIPAASFTLLSTSQKSTAISLDSFQDVLHVANGDTDGLGGSGHWLSYVQATLNLQANEGYQITGVAFSASTYAIHKRPPVPSSAINVDYGTHINHAWSNAAISAPGTSVPLPELYLVEGFTTPVDVGWNLSNTAGLSNFDLIMEVWGTVRTEATFYNVGGGEEGQRKVYGTTELYYVNPMLTVYTAALPVPEPSTWAMLGIGLFAISARHRRAVMRNS
ncbi:PEP-CTERM sorting domain-containing protein [Pseudoduganella lutea]|uniref:PEP-CTERM sorting domain-containing protein n=1 Tax=Pseudoduganella lutea TaxID=321985 RepID=A0A4P6KVA0_9BURK|nr:PEP-CTERM sorting domain-containing protein [Pseudoduganella lutea]QBE62776.1 PEP-CTERM sorting domain-containing protein [Pseudoduganella lutea]